MVTKALVSLSGGMDSATVLGEAIAQGREVSTVAFTYGSKHNPYENKAAIAVAAHYKVPFRLIDLTAAFAGFKSALMKEGEAIPEGHYEQSNMKLTVVPNRNMIFLAILTGQAVSEGAQEIWLGVHQGDFAVYPDCRPVFIEAMYKAIRAATTWDDMEESINLVSPFQFVTKKEILQRGLSLSPPVPYHLTRTCYKDQEKACGCCGSCRERLAAFQSLGIEDPIAYTFRHPNPGSKDD